MVSCGSETVLMPYFSYSVFFLAIAKSAAQWAPARSSLDPSSSQRSVSAVNRCPLWGGAECPARGLSLIATLGKAKGVGVELR